MKNLSFEEAGADVLRFLGERFKFDSWMIAEVKNEEWRILQSYGILCDIELKQIIKKSNVFCIGELSKEVKVAPDCYYTSDSICNLENQQMVIKSYLSQPIFDADGELFGVLCAVDSRSKMSDSYKDIATVKLLGNLLTKILQVELLQKENLNQFKLLEKKVFKDPLTGLYNRHAWEEFLQKEEERCQYYGYSAAILFVDINNLKEVNDNLGHFMGDHLIQQAASILSKNVRSNDILARLGGDEFVILSLKNNESGVRNLLKRIMNAFKDAEISAAIGFSMRQPKLGLSHAAEQADKEMLLNKRRMKLKLLP